ncbi:MAG: glucose-1-phosphate thymidylyltransferase RfbA [Candidatus Faecousia sp.]|uniref:glucose-1-phosphate thymidylyltransferase RfbA n=1 Tax=Faecousia sp. TaxID=2952921 RepID=UPI002A891F6D|nr:glucose-1-phosphate thymidylyltransferase RfbA [Candidatus Faecousia sp.]
MKGIILAGGKGSRLYPMTKAMSKPLIPIYDKPMVYYPLSVLLTAGIRDIMLITAPADVESYQRLLGDGSQYGVHMSYGIQYVARGIADAFLIAEDFLAGDRCCLVLGDNMFHGEQLSYLLWDAAQQEFGATIFGYPVSNPRAYGVVEFDENNRVLSIEEKPEHPRSNYAVPGLYFYDGKAVGLAKTLKPSARGELEITALNEEYLKRGELRVGLMTRGMAWLDTGTPEGMLNAAQYVEAVQSRQGLYIACPEEIAWSKGFITTEQLYAIGNDLKMTEYGQYLLSLGKK